jgi:GPH family glycoside/pentoside/hexuronide:cation symporter
MGNAVTAGRESPGSESPLSLGVKFGYGIGDFAFNLVLQSTSLYLIYFFTDVFLIGAAAAGAIVLVSKLWDAVTDPMMGIISDHTRSRWGKKRPYLLFGALPFGLSIFLLFLAPELSPTGKVIYGFLTFILFSTAITVVNIPYGALTAVLTQDAQVRSRLTAFRMTFALIGTLAAAGATKPLAGLLATELEGFRMVGGLYGIIAVGFTLISFASVRERIEQQAPKRETLRSYLRVVFANPPFLFLALATFLFMTAINMMAAVVNYYFKYNLSSEGLIPIAFLALFVTAALCIPLFVWISNRRSKRFAFALGMGALGLLLIPLYLFGERSTVLTLAIFVVAGLGMSTIYLCPWSMIPDTVEYSEWKTGLRREGILYGAFFFCFKAGAALAGALVGLGLDLSGYQANAAQTAQTLEGIRIMISLVPLGFIILGVIVIRFYSITAQRHQQILTEIRARSEPPTR